ncbi:MAG TPA: TIGR02680 family protein [Pseudonocardiaceae bacterium]|nr:TIGR02680 family protein [Pseudonocardiaceae bacterium]
MTTPFTDTAALGPAWLAAATGGGLPEPTRSRWQPLRVGIVNLWEYDDAEFWFADGRLVLRGGNGAGKTKVLELTTLMLLRGEITASVLDPFGSQHRTMRFNLLPTGEGDDPREPADSGLGYAWVEFGRRDDQGELEFFVCGMGASARRGSGTSGVSTWHFVTEGRPGKDFTLLTGGRAVDQKDLKKIEGVWVPGTATAYRARLAHDLFRLAPESYDNLTELLKQLRKPKLGERLNPASLAETLREALPPLAGHEINQLAEGWDHLEQLRRAVEQTEAAATAVARFVRGGWRPWARVVLRRRADEFATATTTLDNTTREKTKAQNSLKSAQSEVSTAEQQLKESKQDKQDRDTELRALLDSRPYQDAVAAAERVEALRETVTSLGKQSDAVGARVGREWAAVEGARTKAEAARRAAGEAERTVRATSESVRAASDPAGLAESVDRHLPGRDVDALSAEYALRAERFDRLRELSVVHDNARRDAELSAAAVEQAEHAVATARDEQSRAHDRVEHEVDALRAQIRDWAAAAQVARCPAELIEDWCDAVVELTVIDAESGAVRPGASVVEAMRAHVESARDELTARAEQLRLRRAPLARRRAEIDDELAEVRGHAERAPAAPTGWSRRDRPGLDAERGAPFWRLVNPVDGVDGDLLTRLEAGLAASGLLDAWVNSDGQLSTVDGVLPADVQPVIDQRRPDRSLLAVLAPDSAGGVGVEVVRRLLGRIGWFDAGSADESGDWLAADGGWRMGGLVGRATPVVPASYLGAAARAAARQREIDRLNTELAEVVEQLSELDLLLAGIADDHSAVADENRAIPVAAERALATAVATLAERARRLLASERDAEALRQRHADDLTRRDRAWAVFADYAGAHRFGLRDLDAQSAALQDFRSRLTALTNDLELLAVRQESLDTAEQELGEREGAWQDALAEQSDVDGKLRQAKVRLRTAESVVGADHQAQLRRRDELDATVTRLGELIDGLAERLTKAEIDAARADEVLNGHEAGRKAAEEVRDTAMTEFWAAVDGGLAEPVRLEPPDRRNVQAAREFAATVRREITVPAQAADEDRAWRRCYQQMEELRQQLLPNRDARVQDEADSSAIQQVVVLAEPSSGWQSPLHAADALAERVRQQRESYDEEQQRVLATLLGSTFIEHLKERLDYTAHTFAGINQRLADHPTRQGHVVRVVWEADPTDPDARAVVTALGHGYQELSTDRQDMVRSFLARKIDEARGDAAAEGAVDWQEQLALALDYRRWLRISLQYRLGAGGAWVVFDAAKHAAKSGGEKVVLLSQPLFAAAVVAYDAAGPDAPRWVWLDEAMTGVDTAIKASFMGLTVDFELDVMLTAHDEWCNYPTVPAVAVYDLARQQHLPGVDAMPYLWCGGGMTQVDVGRLGVAAEGPEVAGGLFGEHGDG